MDRITIPVQASLLNPNDPSEVTLVADAVSVGVTLPARPNGRIIRWTPEVLRAHYQSMVGKPVNVMLSEDGVSDHSFNVIGTITSSFWDETTQKIRVHASLWRHYFPETVSKLLQFFSEKKLQVSAEVFLDAITEEDGITTPNDISFAGLAIVHQGADLGNRVLVLAAALESDRSKLAQEETVEDYPVLAYSYEWAGEQIASHLASEKSEATVVGTFDSAFYVVDGGKRYRVGFAFDGERLDFEEPVEVAEDATETVNFASRNGAEETEDSGGQNMPDIAELEASLSQAEATAEEWKVKFETLNAQTEADKAEQKRNEVGDKRLAEIEQIAPYKDAALKEEHRELFKAADDRTFEAMKNLVLAAAQPKGGITSDATIEPEVESDDPVAAEALKNLPKWREELKASFGLGSQQ